MSIEPKITVTNLVTVTYQANSYVTPYHFVGKTEAEARQKLQDWLDKKPEPIVLKEDDEPTSVKVDGRSANSGKVWIMNSQLKARQRVLQEELNDFLAKGWVVGGTRTKFDGE